MLAQGMERGRLFDITRDALPAYNVSPHSS